MLLEMAIQSRYWYLSVSYFCSVYFFTRVSCGNASKHTVVLAQN